MRILPHACLPDMFSALAGRFLYPSLLVVSPRSLVGGEIGRKPPRHCTARPSLVFPMWSTVCCSKTKHIRNKLTERSKKRSASETM